MINTKLKAVKKENGIFLENAAGDTIACFESEPYFYIVTGFKSAEAYNEHHADEPVKLLVWKREH
jgi:hypothetical protein